VSSSLPSSDAPVAYLTSMYPKASHTFILREIACLEAAGINVERCSIREPAQAELIGAEEVAEHGRSFFVIPTAKANPLKFLGVHLARAVRQPGRYFKTLKTALGMGRGGWRSALYHLIYFAEAGLLADHLQAKGVRHLHNHFANNSCTVALLAARLADIPFSFTIHGPDDFFTPHEINLTTKIEAAEFVICISHFCRSQCMLFSDRSHWDKLHIMHCGVVPENYQRPRPETSGSELIFVGRIAGIKGEGILLEAVAQLVPDFPDLHLKIVGDGPDKDIIAARTAELGLQDHVTLTGYLSQTGVAEAMGAADIFALPSFAEGVPIVLMEAMATGLPVVTTRIAGISELVEHGVSGALCAPSDVDGLAETLRGLLKDPERQRQMGQAGQAKIAAEFTIETEAQRLIDLLKVA